MSANRWSWIAVVVVVLGVGVLVVRTLQRDASTRIESPADPAARDDSRSDEPRAAAQSAPSAATATRPDSAGARKPGEKQLSSVERAKTILKTRGYYDGPIDNHYDAVLAEALKRFQKDSGMKPTGHLDPQTYAALGVELRRKRP